MEQHREREWRKFSGFGIKILIYVVEKVFHWQSFDGLIVDGLTFSKSSNSFPCFQILALFIFQLYTCHVTSILLSIMTWLERREQSNLLNLLDFWIRTAEYGAGVAARTHGTPQESSGYFINYFVELRFYGILQVHGIFLPFCWKITILSLNCTPYLKSLMFPFLGNNFLKFLKSISSSFFCFLGVYICLRFCVSVLKFGH